MTTSKCETEPGSYDEIRYHCQGHDLICNATGYDMARDIRQADAPTLRDALNHRPSKTQRKLIESRLRNLDRAAKQ